MTGEEILDLPMEENDAKANTIREYLLALLTTLWEEGHLFSGKRPFGNSGWSYDLYKPLVAAHTVRGRFDEYGDIENLDADAAHIAIMDAIKALFLP